jgi:type I restriction enzyme M protein
MAIKVSLIEASTFLGVSRATLRNWDKDGKLTATRNPVNSYRMYDLKDLIKIKNAMGAYTQVTASKEDRMLDGKIVKKTIGKLHTIMRDGDANSNIVTRFDEISKLLFVKLYGKKNNSNVFTPRLLEDEKLYLSRLQSEYEEAVKKAGIIVPEQFSKIKLSADTAYKCGLELEKINMSAASCDIKGLAYEDTIKGTFDKNDNQQFFTPSQIVDFMVKLMAPFLNGIVCDPACGTAGFLTRVATLDLKTNLLGLEVDDRLAWVSNLNLLIHGSNNFTVSALASGGSLGKGANIYRGKIGSILTNPPFGSDYTDQALLKNYHLGAGRTARRRGILFIEQAWNLLVENGVVAIIIDQGVLNAGTTIDVRQYILEHFRLLAVIDLPDSAFMPYANVSASILVMQKVLHPVRQNSVFFAKSQNVGRKANGDDDIFYSTDGEEQLNSDLPDILEEWKRHRENNVPLEHGCFTANLSENLSGDGSFRLDYAYHHPYRKKSKAQLDKAIYKLYRLSEVCEERNESYIPAADTETSTILFTGLSNIESHTGKATQVITATASIKSAVKRYEPNDVVFSKMRPALRKTALMPFNNGGYVSSECAVFSVRKNENNEPIIAPYLLSAILRSDFVYGQIMSCITGIGRPRISGKDVRNIMIPIPPKDVQEKALTSLMAVESSARQLKEKASMLMTEAEQIEQASINNVSRIMAGE